MGSVFLMIISSFIGFVITQNQAVNVRYEQQRATEIAEAGLNYYKWYLAHFPNDLTNGTGLPGPYVEQYFDPEGGAIGEFSLDIASTTYCGEIASIEVTSRGNTYTNPDAISIISAKYTQPTVAEYSFITNGGVWYGDDRVIAGPIHSNQGIRMDGSHNSFVGSGQADWTCTSSFGCSSNQTVDGVYTTSGNATPGLFSYPQSPIDFAGLTLDLSAIRSSAQSDGIYYPPSGEDGYHVIFNGNGTVTIREVTRTWRYEAYSSAEGWHNERNVIRNSSFIATQTIDTSCPVLYFADKVWLEGEISQKITLAAANLSSGAQTNIVLNNDISYSPGGGGGLLAIAEDDIDVGLAVPTNMRVDGIFVAQNGRFGRNHYDSSLPYFLDTYILRDSLTRFGSVVSNGRVGTQWTNGSNTISGFRNRFTSFDRDQVDDPPPMTPETSDVYSFEDWRQEG
jgi:hypothetical protein